jgi:hypothetical protein
MAGAGWAYPGLSTKPVDNFVDSLSSNCLSRAGTRVFLALPQKGALHDKLFKNKQIG